MQHFPSSLMDLHRTCQFCKKIFCCKICRNSHVKKHHPDLKANCPLCSSQRLPLRQYVFEGLDLEDEKLLCHISKKHLPLHCVLCGDLFKTQEDLKFFGRCKWYTERHQLMCERLLPGTPALLDLEAKLKENLNRYSYDGITPPAIYRNTSTPMFSSQKNDFEYQLPCLSNFSLKTPKTRSPTIGQSSANKTLNSVESHKSINGTKFFSFSSSNLGNEFVTPFKSNNDEQYIRENKLEIRKLDIKKDSDETENNEESYEEQVTSPLDMNLTDGVGRIVQDSPKLHVIHEEPNEMSSVTKKVRFSDQNEIPSEFECQVESDAKGILNTTEEEMFHDAREISRTKNTGETNKKVENMENAKMTTNMNANDTKDNQEEVQKDSSVNSSQRSSSSPTNSLSNSQVKMFQNNEKNVEKENRCEEMLVNTLSTVNQQNGSRVLMMVLVENNSEGLSSSLIPLINSGLKKLEEQISSMSSNTAEASSIANPNDYTRQSITKMQMNISSVESYKNEDQRQIVPSSSSPSNENSSGGGILSIFAQAVKYAFKNLSGMASRSIEKTQINQREVVEESLQDSSTSSASSLDSNSEIRRGKRSRDVTDVSPWIDPITLSLEIRSPLPKRQRGWYKIKGRQPISRMRNNDNRVTSRGVSSETQVFRQGSLTVGDTILPLPTRACQSTKKE